MPLTLSIGARLALSAASVTVSPSVHQFPPDLCHHYSDWMTVGMIWQRWRLQRWDFGWGQIWSIITAPTHHPSKSLLLSKPPTTQNLIWQSWKTYRWLRWLVSPPLPNKQADKLGGWDNYLWHLKLWITDPLTGVGAIAFETNHLFFLSPPPFFSCKSFVSWQSRSWPRLFI